MPHYCLVHTDFVKHVPRQALSFMENYKSDTQMDVILVVTRQILMSHVNTNQKSHSSPVVFFNLHVCLKYRSISC